MKFFKKAGKRSYDLFSNYSYYVPGVGGMFMMLLMFLIGSALGSVLMLGLSMFSQELATTYGTMLSYPVMFIPPCSQACRECSPHPFSC